MEKLKNLKIEGVDLRLGVNLERYTTIRLSGFGDFAICKTEESLKKLVKYLKLNELSYHLVGWGANQVLLNSSNVLYIKLDFEFQRSIFDSELNSFELPASVPLNSLTSIAIKKGFKGWEVFTGIPASFGGAICMNAGTSLGEIGSLIKSVRILTPEGEILEKTLNPESFSYRKNNFLKLGEIIISGIITHKGVDSSIGPKIKEYLEYRKSTQPLTTKNCGSVFKNLDEFRAGIVIDSIGLKGFGTEKVAVSYMHANFIENTGSASGKEFCVVIEALKEEIERISGLKFELEVKVY